MNGQKTAQLSFAFFKTKSYIHQYLLYTFLCEKRKKQKKRKSALINGCLKHSLGEKWKMKTSTFPICTFRNTEEVVE